MLDPDPVIDLAMGESREGEAPQPSSVTRKVTAYYMGITLHNNVRLHAFIKCYSNRGFHGSGNPDPHGQDRQMGYTCPPSNEGDPFVKGAPYTFSINNIIIQDSFVYEIVCPLGDITLSTEGAHTLPFLLGHIPPYLRDPRYVMFHPPETFGVFLKGRSFRIYIDKVRGLNPYNIIIQFSTLKYLASGIIYPNILTASNLLSRFSLGDTIEEAFLTHLCDWGKAPHRV